MFFCYMLYTDANYTYIGATTDPERRLKQHNHELSGGAKYTTIKKSQGNTWKIGCVISNIPEWRSALQIEWKWKQLSRTINKSHKNSILRRLYSLRDLLLLEKPTANSIPYDAYPLGPPNIIWYSDELKDKYHNIQTEAKLLE